MRQRAAAKVQVPVQLRYVQRQVPPEGASAQRRRSREPLQVQVLAC